MLTSVLRNFGRECLFTAVETNHLSNPINLQAIRWRRKPRWQPTARSKMFRIPERRRVPLAEELEIRKLYNNYKTQMKSLKSYFALKTKESFTGEEVIAEQKKVEEEDYLICRKLNDEWNAEVALLREARVAQEKEAELEKIIKIIEQNKKLAEERKAELQAIVRQEKEKSKYYITPDNIDEAIDKALSNVVDHNFAIDIQGNIYKGRNAKIPDESVSKVQVVAV